MAKEMGVKIVISTDSHSPRHLDLVRWGVSTARRGWLEKADVLNTIAEPALFLKALQGPRARGR